MQKWSITTDFLSDSPVTLTSGHHLSQQACGRLPEVRRSYDMEALNTRTDLSFSDIYERWDITNQTTHCALSFAVQAHACTGTHKEQWWKRAEWSVQTLLPRATWLGLLRWQDSWSGKLLLQHLYSHLASIRRGVRGRSDCLRARKH